MCFGGRTVKGKKVSTCGYTLVLHRKILGKKIFRQYIKLKLVKCAIFFINTYIFLYVSPNMLYFNL